MAATVRSHLAEAAQRDLVSRANDDVVVQRQAKEAATLLDFLGHRKVGLGRGRIAGRMIVDFLCPVFLCVLPSRSVGLSMACGPKSDT